MRSAFLLLILCTTACSILRPDENSWIPPFSIDKRCEIHPNEKKDTIRGSIQCDGDKYTYEYHENSYQGPLTATEKFRYAFIGNYHNKFFDHIYIDTKLSAKYMDSVEILVIVQKNQFRGTYLFECKACNQVATLRFRKKEYNFPFFSDQALDEANETNFYLDTIDGHYRKIYISKTGKESGLLMEKLVGRRSAKKLAIHSSTTKDPENTLYYLKSVRIRHHDKDKKS